MNYRMIFHTTGKVAIVLAVLLVIPMVLALCLSEACWWTFSSLRKGLLSYLLLGYTFL